MVILRTIGKANCILRSKYRVLMINENTSLMQLISIYFSLIIVSTCFGQDTAHHQENLILYISVIGISPLKLAEEASKG